MESFARRHGLSNDEFEHICSKSDTDYHNKPDQVLMQPSIAQILINKIEEFNIKHGTNIGFTVSSILSMVQLKKNKIKDPKYKEQFELDQNSHGTDYLKSFFRMIISDDPMAPCIMKDIENTQNHCNNRISSSDNPKLFLMFLPMGNDIEKLQHTMINFLEKHKLWQDYYITYSNSKSKLDEDTKKYKKFVDKQLKATKIEGKRGCILLLGNQGKMAYTYHDCDVVIRLDNGTDVDDAEQVGYRCLTEGPVTDNPDEKKNIGIVVDLNIQRTYNVIRNKIKNYKKENPNCKKTFSEIIQYMYKENQFIFNPNEFDFGNCTDEMIEYYKNYENKLKSKTLIDTVICNIQCEDTLCDIIKKIKLKDGTYHINDKLIGKQVGCPKGKKTKKKVDPVKVNNSDSDESLDEDDEVEIDIFTNINKTKNLYEFLTKLCCLMLRIDYKNPNITSNPIELLNNLKKDKIRISIIKIKLIKDYDIDGKHINIIYDKYIIDMDNQNNIDILYDTFEIYSNSDPKVLRDTIGKHFIPSLEQIKNNAEIPTPPKLCDEMIDKIPSEYFMDKNNKTFEPCPGKANLVLSIFERYFNGLFHIEDECERCIYIIENCLYFCDIEDINIYITEELLKCHALSKMKEEFWKDWDNVIQICNVNFNSHVGNTLELNIQEKWGIEGFDAVIGNPPYEILGATGDNKLYLEFTSKALKNWLKNDKYLLFITPPNIIDYYINYESKNRDYIDKFYNILYIAINTPNKYFKVGSKFCYILVQNSNNNDKMDTCIKYLENDLEKEFTMKFTSNTIYPINLMNTISINIVNKIHKYSDEKIPVKNMKRGSEWGRTSNNYFRIRKKQIDDKIVSKIKDNKYKYLIIDKINKGNPDGIKYYVENKLEDHNNKKVIFSKVGYLCPYYLTSGSISDNLLYMNINNKKEYNSIVSIIDSKVFTFLREAILFSGMDWWKILVEFPKLNFNKNYTDKDMYKLFKLTDDEIKYIEIITE